MISSFNSADKKLAMERESFYQVGGEFPRCWVKDSRHASWRVARVSPAQKLPANNMSKNNVFWLEKKLSKSM